VRGRSGEGLGEGVGVGGWVRAGVGCEGAGVGGR
jgi:hypothetical protein